MNIGKILKKKFYNSKIVKRQYHKYCDAFFSPPHIPHTRIQINGNNFYPVSSSAGTIDFHLNDKNPPDDCIANTLKENTYNIIEQETIPLLNFVGKAPGVLIDIGANLGIVSFPFAKQGYKVYGFEANHNNYDQLLKTNEFNKLNADFYNIAVVAKSGEHTFASYGPWGHLTELEFSKQMADETNSQIDKIKGLSIDDWYIQNPFSEPVKLIKIDIEGSELLALQGMTQFLKDKNYPPIYVEANSFCISFNHEMTIPEYLEPFQELGYEAYFIKDANRTEKFNNEFQLNIVENYLMVHKNNQEILQGKTITDVPEYTPKKLMASILRQNLTDQTAFYFAVTFKKTAKLNNSAVFKDFLDYYSRFKEPYSQKIYKELLKLK